jgi:hypothetical protein
MRELRNDELAQRVLVRISMQTANDLLDEAVVLVGRAEAAGDRAPGV